MKKTLALVALVLAAGLTVGMEAEAKRLGAGKSVGMQRQSVTAPSQNAAAGGTATSPGQGAPAAGVAAAAAAPAATATARRSWMGPLAGLAAGLGLAALASHLGFGGALADLLGFALVAMAAMALVGFLVRRRAAGQGPGLAAAAAGGPEPGAVFQGRPAPVQDVAFRSVPGTLRGSQIGTRLESPVAGAPMVRAGRIPEGFDTVAFERSARDQFMALQAANDAGDLVRLRDVLTPEMFERVRADLGERSPSGQTTEVYGLTAQVLDVAEEPDRYVVSVRFTGSVREQAGAVPQDLDETWHLTKPRAGLGGWVIAGIQQVA